MAMSRIAGAARRVVNRVVNRPSAVQKRYYLQLRARLDPLRAPEAERIETDRARAPHLRDYDAGHGDILRYAGLPALGGFC